MPQVSLNVETSAFSARHRTISLLLTVLTLAVFSSIQGAHAQESSSKKQALDISLRFQQETTPGSGRYHRIEKSESWQVGSIAVIVCDMWDSHHCVNAVRRVNEVAPRMNAMIAQLRSSGATVIHAPSGCMDAYAEHAARKRAKAIKPAGNIPDDIGKWCDQITSEAAIAYPLDQSAGGEDDDLVEHQQWANTLTAMGRNPKAPWLKQTDAIEIDAEKDFISDAGPEIWSILEDRGIKHVALVGVHTNMCVLGRPFGLRQLASHGKQVALVRDMTDTMYDPRQWPYVSHFTGTDLIVDHIERHVCPTFASNDVLGGSAFRFSGDQRPTLTMLIGEDEYETEKTLPKFAAAHLGNYRVQYVFADDKNVNTMPGMAQVKDSDALLVSMRRRPLPADQLNLVKQFAAAGKPIIGIRTASHAFSLRNKSPEGGLSDWPEFDKDVLGGSYTNHYANDLHPEVVAVSGSDNHPLAKIFDGIKFTSGGSLYKVSPIGPGTRPLLMGTIKGQPSEPLAWTNVRSNGGRTFYTSLGHKGDFDQDAFRLVLANGIHWACDQPLVTLEQIHDARTRHESGRGKQRK